MLKLQLPEDIENRLDLLSLGSGHTRQFYVMEALMEYLDEVERRQRWLEGVGGTRAAEMPEKEIGRDDRI
ncbi:MAG: ribbon-helix-helix domain-containing protein [Pseudomonadales bacterium]|nr:ribbon-helix-helix domain-containing protein [Pseudomonadales bacterium]